MTQKHQRHDTTRRRFVQAVGIAGGIAVSSNVAAGNRAPSKRSELDLSIRTHLEKMSMGEKIGQLMLSAAFDTPSGLPDEQTRRAIQELHVGSITVFDQIAPAYTAVYNNELQRWATDSGSTVPLFVAADFEYGAAHTVQRGVTTFPRSMGIGATRSVNAAKTVATITAREARAMGFQWAFAPVSDVNANIALTPGLGVRSFGGTPELVSEMTAAEVHGFQDETVMASAKHFPGLGGATADPHLGLPTVTYDRKTLETVHLPPFQAAIDAGIDSIMTAHVIVEAIDPDLPATLSKNVLTGILREQLDFDGLIVTDAMTMNAIDEHWGTGEAAVMSVLAGADIIMATGNYKFQKETYDALYTAVEDGRLSESRLDESVIRVLAAKQKYGVFDDVHVAPKTAIETSGIERSKRAAMDIARQSMTLVTNTGALPLDPGEETAVLLVGVEAVDLFEEALSEQSEADIYSFETQSHEPTPEEIDYAAELASETEVIIAQTYTPWRLPNAQRELIVAVDRCSVPVIGVSTGLPTDIGSYPPVDAALATYAIDWWQRPDRMALQAAAAVLFGATPEGRLPIAISDTYEYGHGLTY